MWNNLDDSRLRDHFRFRHVALFFDGDALDDLAGADLLGDDAFRRRHVLLDRLGDDFTHLGEAGLNGRDALEIAGAKPIILGTLAVKGHSVPGAVSTTSPDSYLGEQLTTVRAYCNEVRTGSLPTDEHSFH